MLDQYTRLSLIVKPEQLERLATKKVLIFGLGGVGGQVVESLARSGVMDFTIVDNDEVNITNINRQVIATLETLGKAKVDVMEERLHSINENIKVTKLKLFFEKDSNEIDFIKYDYIVDAIDTVSAKIHIIEECYKNNIPVMSAMGCGNKLDPSKLVVTDLFKTTYDPLAKVMRRELKARGVKKVKVVYSTEEPIIRSDKKTGIGSSAFVPSVAGIMIAREVFMDLIKE